MVIVVMLIFLMSIGPLMRLLTKCLKVFRLGNEPLIWHNGLSEFV